MRKIAHTALPKASRVINRFHIRKPACNAVQELFMRLRCLPSKPADKWTDGQKQRVAILFEEYTDIKKACGVCHSLRMISAKNTIKDAERLSMTRWHDKAEKAGLHSFNVIAATFEHYDEIPAKAIFAT